MDRYTNYKIFTTASPKRVNKERLIALIDRCKELLQRPYIRFMNVADAFEPFCILYDGDTTITNLIKFSTLETMAKNGKFHK